MPSVERPISARFEAMLRDVLRRLAALERPVRRVVPAGDTLPTSPDEGEQFDLRFAHDGLYRRCTWRGALNGGAGAWAVVGGAALRTDESNSLNTAGTTYQNFFTTVVIPCAGIYDIEFGGLYHTADDANYVRISVDGPGSPATDSDVLIRGGRSSAWETAHKVSRRTFTGSGNVRQYARSNSGGTVTAVTRYMAVTPVELRP